MPEKLAISPHTEMLPVSTNAAILNAEKNNCHRNWQSLSIQAPSTAAVDDSFKEEAEADWQDKRVQRTPVMPFIQKKSGNDSTASDSISSQIESTRGIGIPIPDATKNFMESHFGTDFSGVHVHTGNYASQLSDQLNAHAFTVGKDIYFNEGKYAPESDAGKHLLAHELTHTIQQAGLANNLIKQKAQQPFVQKKWKIKSRTGANPLHKGGQTDEKLLEDAFKEICPLTRRTGNTIVLTAGMPSKSRVEGCNCLSVIDSKVGTLWTSDPEIGIEPFGWSQTGLGSNPDVSVRHPEDPFNWGYWTGTTATHPSETRHLKPFWQTVAHEICGHVAAAARSSGTSVGSRGVGTGHNVAIAGENLVAGEHGVSADEQRGMDINIRTGKAMPGHRGESFLEATVADFIHGSDALPTARTDVINSLVNTVKTTGSSLEMLIQVEGFAYSNEGGVRLAQTRAANIQGEIAKMLSAAGLLATTTGASRFSRNLATITPGTSYPNTSDAGRIVKIYLFHQKHSAGS